MKKANFISQALKNMKHVGALTPSSKFLARKMIKNIDFSKPLNILELGPGTGVVTKQIIKDLNPDSKLVCLELNEDFCSVLKEIKCENLEIVQGSAEHIERIFSGETFDFIISGLPLAIFKKDFVNKVLGNCIDVLSADGQYVQFQYSLASKKTLKRYFDRVEISSTAFNLPPAFVYYCSK